MAEQESAAAQSSSGAGSRHRQTIEAIREQYLDIHGESYLTAILDAIANLAMILNEQRQIIFANHVLLDMLGAPGADGLLGQRPGEILGCVHAHDSPDGCGSGEHCRYCGAVLTVLEQQRTNRETIGETRLTIQAGDTLQSLDFLVKAAPLKFKDTTYTLVTMQDISDQKRRRSLEKIFFHDLLNFAGGLAGFFRLVDKAEDEQELTSYLSEAERISQELIDEIQSQRDLLAAENEDLCVNLQTVPGGALLQRVRSRYLHHLAAREKTIIIAEDSADLPLHSDPTLLLRILGNMLKNALEASRPGEEVRLACREQGHNGRLSVHNQAVMPEDVRSQVFQRSFSTKGTGRGLGTYSIRLIGERFLGGTVGFSSSEQVGTRFYIDVPISGSTKSRG